MEGFIKILNNEILYSTSNIIGPTYHIFIDEKDTYQYPLHGWWYVTDETYLETLLKACNSLNKDINDFIDEELKSEIFELKLSKINIAVNDMILQSNLTANQITDLLNLYSSYEINKSYIINDIFKYNGELYKVVQSHISQLDWEPPLVPALYTKIQPAGVIPNWVQPAGAHDAYQKNDIVYYNGSTWKSTIDNNVWAPDIYGWIII